MFCCVVSLRIFTRCLYFDSSYGLVKIRHNSSKYSAILHNKTSNKIYIFLELSDSFVKYLSNKTVSTFLEELYRDTITKTVLNNLTCFVRIIVDYSSKALIPEE